MKDAKKAPSAREKALETALSELVELFEKDESGVWMLDSLTAVEAREVDYKVKKARLLLGMLRR